MSNFLVYMHENKINGKKYIGITKYTENPNRRWENGRGYFRNKHFFDAIKRYGWENFNHIILANGLNKEEACVFERMAIQSYKTQDKRYGYNITDGGEFFKHTEESKALISKNRKGKGLRHFSEEHRRKISENHGGGAVSKKVLCVENGKIYESINEASRDTGINKKGISGCCRQMPHYNKAGGYHWQFV